MVEGSEKPSTSLTESCPSDSEPDTDSNDVHLPRCDLNFGEDEIGILLEYFGEEKVRGGDANFSRGFDRLRALNTIPHIAPLQDIIRKEWCLAKETFRALKCPVDCFKTL
ncbi:hypothetical protein DPMN_102491 [Dreissena polymorpha]|uniref:Uncharacterized protein n=1 Tax=Dreissena polymorpha TaxID=45954 RepID=A0A9D4LKL0_DREPO|nr:hypothetical protein DPMN_102491 [Dreissena polymorpha]